MFGSCYSCHRACGHIFCDECSKNKIALSQLGYNRPERVCVECYSKLNAAQKTHDTDVRSKSTLLPFKLNFQQNVLSSGDYS